MIDVDALTDKEVMGNLGGKFGGNVSKAQRLSPGPLPHFIQRSAASEVPSGTGHSCMCWVLGRDSPILQAVGPSDSGIGTVDHCFSRETTPFLLGCTEEMYQLLVSTRADKNSSQGKGLLWLRFGRFQTFVGRAWKNSSVRVKM